jgi:hypothetical protein
MKNWNLVQQLDRQLRSLAVPLRREIADPELWCLILIALLLLVFGAPMA